MLSPKPSILSFLTCIKPLTSFTDDINCHFPRSCFYLFIGRIMFTYHFFPKFDNDLILALYAAFRKVFVTVRHVEKQNPGFFWAKYIKQMELPW